MDLSLQDRVAQFISAISLILGYKAYGWVWVLGQTIGSLLSIILEIIFPSMDCSSSCIATTIFKKFGTPLLFGLSYLIL